MKKILLAITIGLTGLAASNNVVAKNTYTKVTGGNEVIGSTNHIVYIDPKNNIVKLKGDKKYVVPNVSHARLVIDNMEVKSNFEKEEVDIKMNVFNSGYADAALIVYDDKGDIINVRKIDGDPNATSVIGDIVEKTRDNYTSFTDDYSFSDIRGPHSSKKTVVDGIKVPKGGRVEICKACTPAVLLNIIDEVVINSLSAVSGAAADSFAKDVMSDSVLAQKIIQNSLDAVLKEYGTLNMNVLSAAVSGSAYIEPLENRFNDIDSVTNLISKVTKKIIAPVVAKTLADPEIWPSIAKKAASAGIKGFADTTATIAAGPVGALKKTVETASIGLNSAGVGLDLASHFVFSHQPLYFDSNDINQVLAYDRKRNENFKKNLNIIFEASKNKIPTLSHQSFHDLMCGTIGYQTSAIGSCASTMVNRNSDKSIDTTSTQSDNSKLIANDSSRVNTAYEQSILINDVTIAAGEWTVTQGDATKHLRIGDSFGSIAAPNSGQIAGLNNADIPVSVMERTFTVPNGVRNVNTSLLANFVTNEFPEYVGTEFNDTVQIDVITGSGNQYQIDTPFRQELNSAALTSVNGLPQPMDATGGQTGFIPVDVNNIPVAGGGEITIRVTSENVGDDLYPSAVLINDTSVATP